jgi:hypothetical protein
VVIIDTEQVLLALAAYVVPVALAALTIASAGADDRRGRVIAALVLMPTFYLAHYHLLLSLQGWPSNAGLPPRFDLAGFRITEPDPRSGSGGEILLWAIADEQRDPRVYRLDYARELHEALVDAGERQQAGQPQSGVVERRSGEGGQAAVQLRFEDQENGTLPPKAS